MTRRFLRTLLRPGTVALCVVALTACSQRDATGGEPTDTSAPQRSANPAAAEVGSAARERADTPQIIIAIGDRTFSGTLNDSTASRELLAQLPMALELSDHGSVEKTGALPARLSTAGSPDGADPDVGDIGYYAPSNDFVLYYGDQGYYPGIVILGRMDAFGPDVVGGMDGDISVSVTRAG